MTVGFFDSGVGGLSVWREVLKLNPKISTIYVADQANFPYGEKEYKIIRSRAVKITEFLINKGVDLIVVACNSATAAALNDLREKFPLPFVGVEPVVKPAAQLTKNKRIAILATPVTVHSKRHRDLITKFTSDVRVLSQPCEDLAEAIEGGKLTPKKMRQILETCLRPVIKFQADVLGLGCTHYPIVKDEIQKILGRGVSVLDSGQGVARRVREILKNLGEKGAGRPSHSFYTTGNANEFKKMTARITGLKSLTPKKVKI